MAFDKFSGSPDSRLPFSEFTNTQDAGDFQVLSVRLREAEHRCFMDQVTESGLSANMALRMTARRISGFLENDEETRTSLREFSVKISAISKALKALSQNAADGAPVSLSDLSLQRKAFSEQFVQLDQRLRAILNVAARRQEGKALLTNAMHPKYDA